MNDTGAPTMGLSMQNCALFLDFDGTLAPIQDDPDTVELPPDGAAVLTDLAARLGGALALISGRDAPDLASRTPQGVWRVGNHGDVAIAPGELAPAKSLSAPAPLEQGVRSIVEAFEGLRLETKGRVLTVHTRKAPEHADDLADALKKLAEVVGGYVIQRGKDVIELKPEGVDKGVVIERLMREAAFTGRTPIFIGDDTTDEDGFRACLKLGGSAVKVGEGQTVAPHRLQDVDAVWSFLKGTARDLT